MYACERVECEEDDKNGESTEVWTAKKAADNRAEPRPAGGAVRLQLLHLPRQLRGRLCRGHPWLPVPNKSYIVLVHRTSLDFNSPGEAVLGGLAAHGEEGRGGPAEEEE